MTLKQNNRAISVEVQGLQGAKARGISIGCSINSPGEATMTFGFAASDPASSFDWLGKGVRVFLEEPVEGYPQDLFIGKVVIADPTYTHGTPGGDEVSIRVTAYDPSHELTRPKANRYSNSFPKGSTLKKIVEDLVEETSPKVPLGPHGIIDSNNLDWQVETEVSNLAFDHFHTGAHPSDYKEIVGMGDLYGFDVFYGPFKDDTSHKLRFVSFLEGGKRKPADGTPKFSLENEMTTASFAIDSMRQYSKVTVTSDTQQEPGIAESYKPKFAPKSGMEIVQQAFEPTREWHKVIKTVGSEQKEHRQAIADTTLARAAAKYMTGNLVFDGGYPYIFVGDVITLDIDGPGTRMDGDYYVTAVAHEEKENHIEQTTVVVCRDGEGEA